MTKKEKVYYALDACDLYGFSDKNAYTKRYYVNQKYAISDHLVISDRLIIIVREGDEYYLEINDKLIPVFPITYSFDDNGNYVSNEPEVRRTILMNKESSSLLIVTNSLHEINNEELEGIREYNNYPSIVFVKRNESRKISENELLPIFIEQSNRNLQAHIKNAEDAKKRILETTNIISAC